jgi:putative membrane-bound dehydrogenase-like protein
MKPALFGLFFTCLVSLVVTTHAQEIYDSQTENVPRVTATEAAASARLPDGFRMQVAASEPMVQQPIGMAWDVRGRLWVAENYTYAESSLKFDLMLSDRIVILEDADKDGTFDKRTVFYENLKELTSIEVVDGGVYALGSPNLVFIADSNRDDVPDGPAQILVSGFNPNIRHNFANGLRFGPDGWLYGRHGILGSSEVTVLESLDSYVDPNNPNFGRAIGGLPGGVPLPPGGYTGPATTPETVRLHCGIWRYHPKLHKIEMVCEGTTNPWGMDWDAYGNLFFINTVIGHLWHAIPGAHLQRMYGEDSDPFAYELLPHIADHVHWDEQGEDWRATRNGPPSSGTDRAGGGHAHSGMMIYQADHWPAEYRNQLFTLNLHGRRINREQLDRVGAGFVGRHQPDMVFWSDPWFRGIELSTAPDGSVYVLDWSDIGECHDDDGVHRTSGRIYRILHDQPAKDTLSAILANAIQANNRSQQSVIGYADCLAILQHPNVWYSRELWKALQFGRLSIEENKGLLELALRNPTKKKETATPSALDPVTLQLRAIWTLNAGKRLSDDHLFRLMRSPQHESVHVWAIRLLAERLPYLEETKQSEGEAELVDLLASKPITEISPLVRLYTAALLPKFTNQQWRLASMLIKSKDLADDRDFPLVYWYGTKDMLADQPMRAAKMAVECAMPKVTELFLRRFASGLTDGEEALSFLLANVASREVPELHASAVHGLWEAYQGRRNVKEPSHWEELSQRISQHPDENVREKALLLKGLFQGNVATGELISLANNAQASQASRRAAILSLGKLEDPAARDALWKLVSDQFLGGAAAESLGGTLTVQEAQRLVDMHSGVWPPGKSGIVVALGSRRDTLPVLLDAIESKKIPSESIDATTWRQFTSVADWDLLTRAREINPDLGVPRDQSRIIHAWEEQFTDERLATADAGVGKTIWNNVCAQCHKLFGEGGAIGPELTGAQRSNLRYWLENVLAPSSVVAANYRVTAFLTDDGRVITGVPIAETSEEVTIQTAKEKIVLSKSEIEQRKASELSLMPEGLMDPLDEKARADLLKYLMSPVQVPAK